MFIRFEDIENGEMYITKIYDTDFETIVIPEDFTYIKVIEAIVKEYERRNLNVVRMLYILMTTRFSYALGPLLYNDAYNSSIKSTESLCKYYNDLCYLLEKYKILK